MADDNEYILELIRVYTENPLIIERVNARLEFGKNKYGHGIIIDDDTTKYASSWDESSGRDWNVMCLEEMLDGIVYACASIIKTRDDKIKKVLQLCITATETLLSI